jgi:hypothetical protein
MEITIEKISKVYELYDELEALKETSSELIKSAKENRNNKILVKRAGGAETEVTEDMLWTEVYHLGDKTEGYEALKNRYPEAFSASDEVNKKLEEIQKYTNVELGIDALQIKLSDILRIVEALVEYKLHGGNSTTTEQPAAGTTSGATEATGTSSGAA